MKEQIANILKEYTKKKGIMASHIILEDYAEEITKRCQFPIKCKNCKNWIENYKDDILNIRYGRCKSMNSPYRYEEDNVAENDFCSYAEQAHPTEKGGAE